MEWREGGGKEGKIDEEKGRESKEGKGDEGEGEK